MKTIEVPVTFSGVVTVLVPKQLTDEEADCLAGKLAMCWVLASVDENPDRPEAEAIDDLIQELNVSESEGQTLLGTSSVTAICGAWESHEPIKGH